MATSKGGESFFNLPEASDRRGWDLMGGVAGLQIIFHPVDTVAKRLMSHEVRPCTR